MIIAVVVDFPFHECLDFGPETADDGNELPGSMTVALTHASTTLAKHKVPGILAGSIAPQDDLAPLSVPGIFLKPAYSSSLSNVCISRPCQ